MQQYGTILQELLLVSRLDLQTEEFYSLSSAACAIQDTEAYMRQKYIEAQSTMRARALDKTIVMQKLPSTKLVREGILLNMAEQDTPWYFFLYTNSLVGAKRTRGGFQVLKTVILDDVSVDQDLGTFSSGAFVAGDPVTSRSVGHGDGFIVSDGAVTLELAASSPHQKELWVADLQQCIQSSKTAQVMKMYSGLQGKLETIIERAALVDERVADEQSITAAVATRGLEAVDNLAIKVEQLSEALGAYEEEELWPRIVSAFVEEWKPENTAAGSREQLVSGLMDELIEQKYGQLEQGLAGLDDTFIGKLDQVIANETKDKQALEHEVVAVWGELEQQFGAFEREMDMLEAAMDEDLAAQRATALTDCDQLQQNIYGLDKKTHALQVDTADTEKINQRLADEIAERMEELQLMQQRLAQL